MSEKSSIESGGRTRRRLNASRAAILLAAGLLSLTQLGSSCMSDTSDTGRGDSDGAHRDYDRPSRIPRYADVVREGSGKLKWAADMDGSVYVYDADYDRVAYSGPVRRDDEIVVQPGDDKITINDRVVSTDDLKRDDHHQIYFASQREADRNRDRDDDRGRDVPADATRVDRGTDDLVIHAATSDGTVYVYDEDDRVIVYTSRLDRGNSFQMFPAKGYVNLNSKRAADVRFRKGHRYALYFKQR